jgi:hypothetical protein
VHAKPALQVPVLPVPQQDCPEAPQAAHTLPVALRTHDWPVVVQGVPPEQQAWPSPPQGLQVPAVPEATSLPLQAKPVLQVPVLPVPQQAWPEPPHVVHTLPVALTTQESVASVQGVPPPGPPPPVQQAWPSAPQGEQVPGLPDAAALPVQAKPVLQVPVLPVPQQAWPEPPQVEQTLPPEPSMQERPVSQEAPPMPPGQQASP